MPIFLSKRFQPPFDPLRQAPRLLRKFVTFICALKGVPCDCRMCGNCILPETAFICPMTCPRGLRNGPCRGSSPHHCFVEPSQRCVWYQIYARVEQQGHLDDLLEIQAPLSVNRSGCELLLGDYQQWCKQHRGPHLRQVLTDWPKFNVEWKAFRYKSRQPDWWQGDSRYHPQGYTEPVSKLEAVLHNGQFVISAEVAPPMEASGEPIAHVAQCLKKWVTTLNFTDNPLGVPRMSGLACALHSLKNGVEPVLQLQTRHRSRYEVQAEVVGAAAVGVRNILCMSNDFGRLGPGPRPKPEINDLDAVQALWMLRRLRDEGINVDGDVVEHRPECFLGAMASPFAALPRYEAIVTEKKINAGAQFLQTLPIFDLARFDEWLEVLDKRNLLGKVYLIATVAFLKSPRHTRFMANEVPGVYIPTPIMARMDNAADPREEGLEIALNIGAQLKQKPGIHGLHIFAPHEEEIVPRLLKALDFRVSLIGRAVRSHSTNGHGKKNDTQPFNLYKSSRRGVNRI